MDKTYNDGLIESLEEENKAYAEELQARREKRESSIKNLKVRKSAFRKKIAKFVLVGTVAATAIGATYAYANDPERIVSSELLADAGLTITDNSRRADGQMTEQELIDYINKNNVSMEEVVDKVADSLNWNDIDTEYGMEKVESANPDVFEEGKGMGK